MGRSKEIRKLIFGSLVLAPAIFLTAVTVDAQGFGARKKLPQKFDIKVTGVNNTNHDGVTRLQCEIVGFPHTSQRIDGAFLKHNGKQLQATDIDGVDFNRYFQWEDDGVVTLEIDFPLTKNLSPADSLIFQTVNGRFGAPLGKFKTYR